MQTLKGRGVADGIAIGRAVSLQTRIGEIYRFPIAEGDVGAGVERFGEALRITCEEVGNLTRQVGDDLGEELAGIFEAHLLLLQDASFTGRVVDVIESEKVNAEYAVHEVVEELEERFARIDNEYLRERNEDVRDVSRRLLRTLSGFAAHELSEIEGDVVVVADDLTPSEAVHLGRQGVRGFVLEGGGRTSHTTIIARSLNVPLVAGVEGITRLATDEDPVIVEGSSGTVVLHPTPDVLADYTTRRSTLADREAELLATCDLAACTSDGVSVSLLANVDLPEEIEESVRFGAAGVGLYRSEFLYIEKSPEMPSEEEHLDIYRRIVEAAAPYPAVIRTYDLGGRKLAREVMHIEEENPVLGLRGIRLTLARPEAFRTQLRGLFRAALHGDLWVLLPMITTLDEVGQYRDFAAGVMDELAAEGVPFNRDYKLGVMIEVPSAALTADLLARHVDFFAIGTNDLIQYAMAVDRNNEHVADLYQPLHPAVLRMLRSVVEAAARQGIDVEICGEMASDARLAPLLVGLGLRRLSMSPRVIPAVKTRIRELDSHQLSDLARRCLDLETTGAIERELDAFLAERCQPQEAAR
ncbi:MAG TPA: phosphoenolpyruvate--protein phosphotransferase [Thermoanaerobaculia bacterium]|nr:phosphoenolpyruvate--protein phosphotransferase [Thermoanaerobaculia bacterium]